MKRCSIALKPVTLNALRSLIKYRETIDDVVLKAVIVYAKSLNLESSEQIIYAISEANSRFGENVRHIGSVEGTPKIIKPSENNEDAPFV